MWGKSVYTKYSNSCLRSILIKSRLPKYESNIDVSHQIRGKHNEDTYEQYLIDQGIPYEREVAITKGDFSGHIDFFTHNIKVVELKSSQSKSRKSDIKKGEYVVENLAQAVAYMLVKETVVGELIYSFWSEDTSGELKYEFNYVHKILVDDFGRICLNGLPTQWTVYDLLAHQHHALKVQNEGIVWDRPHNYDLMWGSPCKYCPFSKACDAYDTGAVTDADGLVQVASSGIVPQANSNVGEINE